MKKRILSCVLSVALLVCMTIPYVTLPIVAETTVLTKESTGVTILTNPGKPHATQGLADIGPETIFTDLGKNLMKNATYVTGDFSDGLTDFKRFYAPGIEYVDEKVTVGDFTTDAGKALALSKLSDDRVGAYGPLKSAGSVMTDGTKSTSNQFPVYRVNKVGFKGSGGYATFSVKLKNENSISKIMLAGSASDDGANIYVKRFYVYANKTGTDLFNDNNKIVDFDNSALSYGLVIDLITTLGNAVDAQYLGFKVSTEGSNLARIDEIGVYATPGSDNGITLFEAPVDQAGAKMPTIDEWECFTSLGTNLLSGSTLQDGNLLGGLTDFKGFAPPNDGNEWLDETAYAASIEHIYTNVPMTATGKPIALSKVWDNKAGSYSVTKQPGSTMADGTKSTTTRYPMYRTNSVMFSGVEGEVTNKAGQPIAGNGWAHFSFKMPKAAKITKVMVTGSMADNLDNRYTYRFKVYVGNDPDKLYDEANMVIDYDNSADPSADPSYGVVVDLTEADGAKVRTGRYVSYCVCAGTTEGNCRLDELGVYGTPAADPNFTVTEVTAANYATTLPSLEDNLIKGFTSTVTGSSNKYGNYETLYDGMIAKINAVNSNAGMTFQTSGSVAKINNEPVWLDSGWAQFGFDLGDFYQIDKLLVAGSPNDNVLFNDNGKLYDNKNVRYLEVYVSDTKEALFQASSKVMTFDNRVDPVTVFTLEPTETIRGRYVAFRGIGGAYNQLRLQELGIYGSNRGYYYGVSEEATVTAVTEAPAETSLIKGKVPTNSSGVTSGKKDNMTDGFFPGINTFVMPQYDEEGNIKTDDKSMVLNNLTDLNCNLSGGSERYVYATYDLGATAKIDSFAVGSSAEPSSSVNINNFTGKENDEIKQWYLEHVSKYVRLHRGAFYVSDSENDLFNDDNKVTYWDYTFADKYTKNDAKTPLAAQYTLKEQAEGRYVGFRLYTVGVNGSTESSGQWGWWGQARIGELAVYGTISVTAPTALTGLVYNSTAQTGVAEGTGYTVTDGKKTAAGNYTATATLKENYVWSDGSTEAKSVEWSIARKPIAKPTPAIGIIYNGEEKIGVAEGEGYTLTGDAVGTAAGNYTATATLKENYVWSDDTEDPVDVAWSILTVTDWHLTENETDVKGRLMGRQGKIGNGDIGRAIIALSEAELEEITGKLVIVGGDYGKEATVTLDCAYTYFFNRDTQINAADVKIGKGSDVDAAGFVIIDADRDGTISGYGYYRLYKGNADDEANFLFDVMYRNPNMDK